MFSSELRDKAKELVERYPVGRSALLPLLHLVQSQDGYLSDDGISECAELLGLTKAEVASVATFYTMYKREPMGRHLVSVCTNFSCKVRGAQDVYDHLADTLGVGHNQTTDDGTFTLEHAECLGNCEGAPVVSIDYFNYEAMTPSGAERLLEQVASGEVPLPTRGVRSPGIRPVSHRLAGVGPHPDDGDRGADVGQVASPDGPPPPAAAAEVGPDAAVQVVTSEFTHQRDEQRADARQQVRSTGTQPTEIEQDAGPEAREFPSRSPDSGMADAGGADAHDGPGANDAGEAGEG